MSPVRRFTALTLQAATGSSVASTAIDRRHWAKAIADYSKALELNPRSQPAWHARGVAQYRIGDWKDSNRSLTKSAELHKGGDAFDWFYLAMANWKFEQKDEAHKAFERAVQWMNKNAPQQDELRRLRDEAATLLGIESKKSDLRETEGDGTK